MTKLLTLLLSFRLQAENIVLFSFVNLSKCFLNPRPYLILWSVKGEATEQTVPTL